MNWSAQSVEQSDHSDQLDVTHSLDAESCAIAKHKKAVSQKKKKRAAVLAIAIMAALTWEQKGSETMPLASGIAASKKKGDMSLYCTASSTLGGSDPLPPSSWQPEHSDGMSSRKVMVRPMGESSKLSEEHRFPARVRVERMQQEREET